LVGGGGRLEQWCANSAGTVAIAVQNAYNSVATDIARNTGRRAGITMTVPN
jgi:hypothetical protein